MNRNIEPYIVSICRIKQVLYLYLYKLKICSIKICIFFKLDLIFFFWTRSNVYIKLRSW